ncbi:MAG: thioredoxin family protein [Deltaproteobacteria bacterium]|nr:thioredoxin family protein [Deltaproteobacteria bacterium]
MPAREDLERVMEGMQDARVRVTLTLHPGPGETPFSKHLIETARSYGQAAGGTMEIVQGEPSDEPLVTICATDRCTIRYHAVPEGPEAAPFVQALIELSRGGGAPGGVEAQIVVFIAPACPHCPRAVSSAIEVALANSAVTVSVVDAQQFPELAERHAVRSVPLTLIDGELRLTGVVEAGELAEQLLERESGGYEARVLRSLLEGGLIEEAARKILTHEGSAAFVSEWAASTTSSRMGLMLAAAEAMTLDATTLDGRVEALSRQLGSDDAALRGDTADMLGQIGHPSAEPRLLPLLEDSNPDVAEIAAEAIELVRARGRLVH